MNAAFKPYHHGRLRDALLEAAEIALEAGGPQSLSLREVSRALGVSHSSPRRHFTHRQALLDALAARGFERLGVALRRASEHQGQGFDRQLTELARAHVAFAVTHPALFAWMFEAKQRAGAPRELLSASEEASAPVATVFRAGQADGSVIGGDPDRLGLVGFAAMQGLIAMSNSGQVKGIPLDDLVGEVIERLVLGLRPRPHG